MKCSADELFLNLLEPLKTLEIMVVFPVPVL